MSVCPGRVLGLDVGTKTIGMALSDPTQRIATPLSTLSRKGVKKDCARLAEVCAEHAVQHVVVGLPYELDGTETRSARLARQIGEGVTQATSMQVTYVDERFSSVDAERRLIELGWSRDQRNRGIDAAAAALILQSFLDHGDWTEDGG